MYYPDVLPPKPGSFAASMGFVSAENTGLTVEIL